MTLVYDEGVFKPRGPVPASMKDKEIVHVVIVETGQPEGAVKSEGGSDDRDGWTMFQSLVGCITDTPVGEHIGRDHDKYLYGR